jgi:hypothetical protein
LGAPLPALGAVLCLLFYLNKLSRFTQKQNQTKKPSKQKTSQTYYLIDIFRIKKNLELNSLNPFFFWGWGWGLEFELRALLLQSRYSIT